ncbi:hypothetical protein BKA60DRAFT_646455 [Fusarium oxysporum]|uniref:Uncharacterized protein n=1 Tax=Fusarium oxysporum TaxID=5507 RepID=A0A420NCA4_FUSOX|nr:hypothetical protein BKA60DRAFT_646455 [Fusarium oxysporum]RKK77903.1 hypothetical protein BFJ69_g5900 [Fusarium oxysporum]
MAPETKTVPDPTKVNPLSPDARRQYMDACFRKLPISSDMRQQARTKAIELQSKHLVEKGLRDVNVVYFEYHVDVIIWRLIFNRLCMIKNNPWPCTVSLDENDLSQGTSSVFREWRQSHGPSGETQESSSTPRSQAPRSQHQAPVPQTLAEAKQMAREARERANELELEAFRLERIARQWPVDDKASCFGGLANPQAHHPRYFSGLQPLDGREFMSLEEAGRAAAELKKENKGCEVKYRLDVMERDAKSLENKDILMRVTSTSRAMKRSLTGGEERDAENLSNEDTSMSVSSSSKRPRPDNNAAVDPPSEVGDSQDEPSAHP